MSEGADIQRLPELDNPWRRLPWVTLAAIAIWIGLLAAFSFLLERSESPSPEIKPLEARIVEVPKEVGGLAGGGGAPAHAPAAPKPKVAPAHVPPVARPKKVGAPPMPILPNGTATTSAAPAPRPSGAPDSSGNAGASEANAPSGPAGNGTASGPGGIGSDSLGAHAIYAPMPEIPDDLRENAINTMAVAHFSVTADGQVTVSLAKQTESPELNEILLDTLKQWRFFPAMKNGVAIDSEFDLNIPITVQ